MFAYTVWWQFYVCSNYISYKKNNYGPFKQIKFADKINFCKVLAYSKGQEILLKAADF